MVIHGFHTAHGAHGMQSMESIASMESMESMETIDSYWIAGAMDFHEIHWFYEIHVFMDSMESDDIMAFCGAH